MIEVCVFESEERARAAANGLIEVGFREETVFVLSPDASATAAPARRVREAIESGALPGSHTGLCLRSLEQGRSIVSVRPPFGKARLALDVLEQFGPLRMTPVAPASPRDPSPLSDLLGLPTLTSGRVDASEMAFWADFKLFGRTRLSDDPTPLSSKLGLAPLVAEKRDRRSSFGLPLLSKNPAPLSSMLGLKLLTPRKGSRDRSFGLPLLTSNPTPFSSFFSLPVLTRRKGRDRR